MNIPNNFLKTGLLAFVVFWSVLYCENEFNDFSYSVVVLFSFIPILISVMIVVGFTICSFFWTLANEKKK